MPSFPEFDQEFLLAGINEQQKVKLYLRNINRTAIGYRLLYGEDYEYSKEGTAHLSPFYIMGAESDEDDKTGEFYFCYDYFAESPDNHVAIRLSEVVEDEPLRAKVTLDSDGSELPPITLNNCPTLRPM